MVFHVYRIKSNYIIVSKKALLRWHPRPHQSPLHFLPASPLFHCCLEPQLSTLHSPKMPWCRTSELLPTLVPLPGKLLRLPNSPPPPGCSDSLSLVIISNEMVHSRALSEYSPISMRLPTSSDHLCTSLDVRAGFLMMDRRAQSILGMYNSAELQEHPPPPPSLLPCPSHSSPTFQASSHLRAIVPDRPFV